MRKGVSVKRIGKAKSLGKIMHTLKTGPKVPSIGVPKVKGAVSTSSLLRKYLA